MLYFFNLCKLLWNTCYTQIICMCCLYFIFTGMNDFDLMLLRRGSILLTVDLFLLIILNFLKFLRRRLNYFKHLASWIDTTFQTLSVMCVTLHYKGTDDCFCSSTNTWQIAVITLFIGWIGLIVHLNKLPLTGIIINMLLSIFQTFIKLVIIATLLCFAFALPFYLLLSLPVSIAMITIGTMHVFYLYL